MNIKRFLFKTVFCLRLLNALKYVLNTYLNLLNVL